MAIGRESTSWREKFQRSSKSWMIGCMIAAPFFFYWSQDIVKNGSLSPTAEQTMPLLFHGTTHYVNPSLYKMTIAGFLIPVVMFITIEVILFFLNHKKK